MLHTHIQPSQASAAGWRTHAVEVELKQHLVLIELAVRRNGEFAAGVIRLQRLRVDLAVLDVAVRLQHPERQQG